MPSLLRIHLLGSGTELNWRRRSSFPHPLLLPYSSEEAFTQFGAPPHIVPPHTKRRRCKGISLLHSPSFFNGSSFFGVVEGKEGGRETRWGSLPPSALTETFFTGGDKLSSLSVFTSCRIFSHFPDSTTHTFPHASSEIRARIQKISLLPRPYPGHLLPALSITFYGYFLKRCYFFFGGGKGGNSLAVQE